MEKVKNGFSTIKRKRLLFYIAIMFLPMVQIAIFYVYANFQTITLAFTEYDGNGGYTFVGLKVFKQVFEQSHSIFRSFSFVTVLKNSVLLYVILTIFGFPGMFFSYYVFKKYPFGGAFKIILYIPHIVSVLVCVVIYKYFMDDLIPSFGWIKPGFWTSSLGIERFYYTFFCIFISYGSGVLIYSSTMSSISESIMEQAKLDGITPFKELFLIVIPLIWPTFAIFYATGLINIFTHQMAGFTFKGADFNPQLQTFGYFLFIETSKANMGTYPILSALGLLSTLICAPITLFVRWALLRFGPSTD